MEHPVSFEIAVQRDEPPAVRVSLKNRQLTMLAEEAANSRSTGWRRTITVSPRSILTTISTPWTRCWAGFHAMAPSPAVSNRCGIS